VIVVTKCHMTMQSSCRVCWRASAFPRGSIPKHGEIAFRCDPIVFFKLMLDAILKLARSRRKLRCDLVGTARRA
jgi:hypothetical protein